MPAVDKTLLTTHSLSPKIRRGYYLNTSHTLAQMAEAGYWDTMWSALPRNTMIELVGAGNVAGRAIVTASSERGGVTVALQVADVGAALSMRGQYYLADRGVITSTTPLTLAQKDANAAAINAAIAEISAGGGGTLWASTGDLQHTGIVLKSNVLLRGSAGSKLSYTGSGIGITSPTDDVLLYAGLVDLTIDAGASAAHAVKVLSSSGGIFEDLIFAGNNDTVVSFELGANTSGGLNADGNRNSVGNSIEDIYHAGRCGKLLRFNGANGAGSVVTLNTVSNVTALRVLDTGIDFAQWCDNNPFSGTVRVSMIGSNSAGVVYNSADPTNNVGVYANNFDHLAVDTFVIGGVSGRVGVKINNAKQILIDDFYQYPNAEGGAVATIAQTGSYLIRRHNEVTGKTEIMSKGQVFTSSIDVTVADGAVAQVLTGGTLAVRTTMGASATVIEGMNAALAAYGTLGIGGSQLSVLISGVTHYVGNGSQWGPSGGKDNAVSSGGSGSRWSVVYAGTGTINTSDEREKTDIRALNDAERRVAQRLKGLVTSFRFRDAVAEKGDGARIHVGVIAQRVIDAFAAESLDARRYALLCHDTWDAQPEEYGIDLDGQPFLAAPARPAGDRYGVRYDQLLAFLVSAL